MPKLAIIGTVEVAPERKKEFLSLLMAHRARCVMSLGLYRPLQRAALSDCFIEQD